MTQLFHLDKLSNFSFADNMGLICDQVESTLKDEVNHEEVKQLTSNKSSDSSRRRRKQTKQSRNFVYNLFKWYFKSRALQDESTNDYEISQLSCNDDDASLAYRQQKHPRTSLAKDPPSISNLSHSHYLVRQSICLYAASSVILALCYFATPSSAAPENPSHPL